MTIKVLLTDVIRPRAMDELEKHAEVVIAPDPSPETVSTLAKNFDGIISRNTFIGEACFANSPKLKVVASHGVGTDHIDVNAATRYGVRIVNTPGANSISVAETVIGLMLCLSRKLCLANNKLKFDSDYYCRHDMIGQDLHGKTLGIIGMGHIGKTLSNIARNGFEMDVLALDPYVDSDTMLKYGAKKAGNLHEVLLNADYLSLNCPYNKSLHHLINSETLQVMKKSAFLINCSRGLVIDEKALYIALKEGVIAGAALDVFEEEPPEKDNPLFELENVIVTPHIAANAVDSIDRMSLISVQDVIHVIKGEDDKAHVVNAAELKEE